MLPRFSSRAPIYAVHSSQASGNRHVRAVCGSQSSRNPHGSHVRNRCVQESNTVDPAIGIFAFVDGRIQVASHIDRTSAITGQSLHGTRRETGSGLDSSQLRRIKPLFILLWWSRQNGTYGRVRPSQCSSSVQLCKGQPLTQQSVAPKACRVSSIRSFNCSEYQC